MNGPTFAATSAAPARPVGARPTAHARPPHKPDVDNPAARMLAYVRLHWLTIAFAGALLGAGLGYAAWTLLPPKYESYALFRVPQVNKTVGSTGETARNQGNFTTLVKTYATMMKYEYVYRYALREGHLADLPTLKGQKDPQKFLDEKLMVSSKEGSEIITMSLQGENPDDVREIVDWMVKAYENEVINKERTEANKYREQLLAAKQTLEKQLSNFANRTTTEQPNGLNLLPGVAAADKGKDGKLELVVPALPGQADPNVKQAGAGGGKEGILDSDRMRDAKFNPLMSRYMKLEESIPDLHFKIAKAKADITAINMKLKEVTSEAAPADLEKAVRENDPDVRVAKAKADRLRSQLEQNKVRAKDPNAASFQRMEAEIELAQSEVEKVVREKVKALDDAQRKPRVANGQLSLDNAHRELAILEGNLKLNLSELERVKADLKAIPTPPEVKERLERERSVTPDGVQRVMLEEKLHQIAAEYQIAELNAQAPPRIVLLQEASSPVQKDAQKQILATVFASLLGFALVGAVCVGLEMRARKVSSLGELKAAAPAPVVGVVPHQPDAATARDPVKRAEVNESIDKLRAYVAQSWLSRGATTVTVTSPLGDEGKSFTAFGLASSLAQAGMKTLLVDFDLRNPALHTYAGMPNDMGVCELLRGEADFRRTIQVLPNGLHFLSGGKWSDDARQAAVGGRLEALLARLKEPFDCVVLHADALLTVAESVEVARRSEVLLLCALYRTTRTPLLRKATDRAAAMEIPYTGVVYVGATASEALC